MLTPENVVFSWSLPSRGRDNKLKVVVNLEIYVKTNLKIVVNLEIDVKNNLKDGSETRLERTIIIATCIVTLCTIVACT